MIHYYIIGGVILVGLLALIPVAYTIKSYLTYAYINGRLRARQNQFVSPSNLKNYADRSFEDIIYSIDQNFSIDLTQYLQPDISYSALDNALRTHHIDDINTIRRSAPHTYDKFFDAYQDRFIIRIIKNIVRRKRVDLAEQTRRLPGPNQFSLAFRQKQNPALQELRDELRGTTYGSILDDYQEQIANNDYKAFENELNKAYLNKLDAAAPTDTAKDYVKTITDQINLSLALNEADTYAETGRIPSAELKEATTVNAYEDLLANHGYDINADTKEELEHGFRQHLQDYATRLKTKQPLSDAIILSYLLRKNRNVQNLSILLKLSYHETPPAQIKGAMTL